MDARQFLWPDLGELEQLKIRRLLEEGLRILEKNSVNAFRQVTPLSHFQAGLGHRHRVAYPPVAGAVQPQTL